MQLCIVQVKTAVRDLLREIGWAWPRACELGARSLVPVLMCLAFSGCYLIAQGGYIVKYNRDAVAIDVLIEENGIPSEKREFLLQVKRIKNFATDTMGLKRDANYTRYVEVDKTYLLDVVSASEADAFVA